MAFTFGSILRDEAAKMCVSCGGRFPDTSQFYYTKSPGRLDTTCRECRRIEARRRRAENPEKSRATAARSYQKNRTVRLASQKAYSQQNRERVLAKTREYHSKHRERLYKKADERRRANLPARSKQQAAYVKRRRETDPIFAITFRVRNLIKESLRARGYQKGTRTERILGCSWEQFRAHIENGFVDGMNWGNRSEWHLDHIVPLASASTEAEVLRLNHYSNLRPLWARDNLIKGAKHLSANVI